MQKYIQSLHQALKSRLLPARKQHHHHTLAWTHASSLEEARKQASGYDDPDFIRAAILQAKMQKQSFESVASIQKVPNERSFFQHILAFEKAFNDGARDVYEVGGAGGNWALILQAYLKVPVRSWIIREQPAIVKYAVDSGWQNASGLSFISDRLVPEYPEHSVYFIQGTLQFMDDPMEELRWAFSQGFAWVYFSRTTLLTDSSLPLYFVQRHFLSDHAPGFVPDDKKNVVVSAAQTLISEKAFFDVIPSEYERVFFTEELAPHLLPVPGIHNHVKDIGLLLKRRTF
jgi:putative methyltransferase (TIGR04325 family)